jgi:hypothetical protein
MTSGTRAAAALVDPIAPALWERRGIDVTHPVPLIDDERAGRTVT